MINVVPTPALTVNYIFPNSKGERQSLHPAESLESKDPQVFDESDPVVAKKILGQIKAKTVKVDKADKALLNATIARAEADVKIAEKLEDVKRKALEAEAFGGSDGKSIKKAVSDVHAEYAGFISPDDHKAAIEAAVAEATAGDGKKSDDPPKDKSKDKSKGK